MHGDNAECQYYTIFVLLSYCSNQITFYTKKYYLHYTTNKKKIFKLHKLKTTIFYINLKVPKKNCSCVFIFNCVKNNL